MIARADGVTRIGGAPSKGGREGIGARSDSALQRQEETWRSDSMTRRRWSPRWPRLRDSALRGRRGVPRPDGYADDRSAGEGPQIRRLPAGREEYAGPQGDRRHSVRVRRRSLKGPLILAFSKDDPGAAARLVKAFAKDHDKLMPTRACRLAARRCRRRTWTGREPADEAAGARRSCWVYSKAPICKFVAHAGRTPREAGADHRRGQRPEGSGGRLMPFNLKPIRKTFLE